ncbi:hypothetical protein ANO11243_071100 [Dothideomycetidae sp. 11243]|nr:hypothetical protein ANO11243_071100 [fungal sp. No.11243]
MSSTPISFESFPLEILHMVLMEMPDMESLDNLVRASPSAYWLFPRHGVEIIERVVDSGYVYRDSQILIRTIAYIRTGDFPFTSLSELQQRVTSVSLTTGTPGRESPDYHAFRPARFPQGSTPSLMLGILATLRRITFLTLDCIDVHLKRLRSSRPYQSANGRYGVTSDSICYNADGALLRDILQMDHDDHARVSLDVKDIGPATWVEEQTVYRTFLQIQLNDDLRLAVHNNIVRGWTYDERLKLTELAFMDIYDFEEMSYWMQLIFEWIHDKQDPLPGYAELQEPGVVLTVLNYLDERRKVHGTLSPTPSWSRRGPAPSPRKEDCDRLVGELSAIVGEFVVVYTPDRCHDMLGFGPYRRLGFSLWCEERLRGYGVLLDDNTGLDLITWISFLDDEDRNALRKGVLKPGWCRGRDPLSQRTTVRGRTISHTNPVADEQHTIMYYFPNLD